MLTRRRETHARDLRIRRNKLVGALAVMALAIGVLGAYSFAEQGRNKPDAVSSVPSGAVRTTPDAPSEVPPPVEPTK